MNATYMIKGGVTYKFVTDQIGSVRLVVDSASGSVAQVIEYDEFGRILSDSNPGFQPFAWAGGLYDGQTSLIRFGRRDYDAEIGRWIAKDPIGFSGQDHNLYGYCVGNPINKIDPTGELSPGEIAFLGGLLLLTLVVYAHKEGFIDWLRDLWKNPLDLPKIEDINRGPQSEGPPQLDGACNPSVQCCF